MPSDGADEIVKTMAAIANKVSGRSLVSSSNITYIDSKTVSILSEVPLMNISVLSQKSSAKVETIPSSSGSKGNSMWETTAIFFPATEQAKEK